MIGRKVVDRDPAVADLQAARHILAMAGKPTYDRTRHPPPFSDAQWTAAFNETRIGQGRAPRNSGAVDADDRDGLLHLTAGRGFSRTGPGAPPPPISPEDAPKLIDELKRLFGLQEGSAPEAEPTPAPPPGAGVSGEEQPAQEEPWVTMESHRRLEAFKENLDKQYAAQRAEAEAETAEAGHLEAEEKLQELESLRKTLVEHGVIKDEAMSLPVDPTAPGQSTQPAPFTPMPVDDLPTHTGHPPAPPIAEPLPGPSTDPDPRLTERPPGFGEGGVPEVDPPTTPIPEPTKPEIEVFPMREEDPQDYILKAYPGSIRIRWYNTKTGDLLKEAFEARGFEVKLRGGRFDHKGVWRKEEWLTPHADHKDPSSPIRNGSAIDITLQITDMETGEEWLVHVNTAAMLKDGETPTRSERRQVEKVLKNKQKRSSFMAVRKPIGKETNELVIEQTAQQRQALVDQVISDIHKHRGL